MDLEEAQMSLFLMGWIKTDQVPIYWERWCKGADNVYFRLDIDELHDVDRHRIDIGRFAQDGNSVFGVSSYKAMIQMASDIPEVS